MSKRQYETVIVEKETALDLKALAKIIAASMLKGESKHDTNRKI